MFLFPFSYTNCRSYLPAAAAITPFVGLVAYVAQSTLKSNAIKAPSLKLFAATVASSLALGYLTRLALSYLQAQPRELEQQPPQKETVSIGLDRMACELFKCTTDSGKFPDKVFDVEVQTSSGITDVHTTGPELKYQEDSTVVVQTRDYTILGVFDGHSASPESDIKTPPASNSLNLLKMK